jgi:hypothetical protein
MDLETQRSKQLAVSVVVWLALAATAQAGDPEPPGESPPRAPRAVRQAGGEHGPKLNLKRAGEAEPTPGSDVADDRAKVQEKFRAAHAAIKRAREQRGGDSKDARERMKLEHSSDPAQSATGEKDDALASDEERAQKRLERGKRARRMAWRGMMHRFKRPADIPPDIRNELRHHARRLARLQRIRAVAQEKRDQGVLTRIDKLMTLEQERHHKKMRVHWDALARANAAAAPVAPPAADPKAAPGPDPEQLGGDPDPETPEDEDEEQGGEP